MPAYTTKDIQALRKATGAPMMDTKRALDETDGDVEAAKQWLREKGLVGAAKRDDRSASEGAVAAVRNGNAAAIVELRCETDFVAKADDFVALADEVAALVAAKGEAAAEELSGEVERLRTTLQENISLGQVVRLEAEAGDVVDTYVHLQDGRGVNAVGLVLHGGNEALAHEIAVHIAFGRPTYLRREDVPEAEVAAERETVEAISRNEGKPEAALPKIVEGRMNGWFRERVLLEQAYVKDEKKSIADLLGSAEIVRYAQVAVGS